MSYQSVKAMLPLLARRWSAQRVRVSALIEDEVRREWHPPRSAMIVSPLDRSNV
jgi:hypothetical protein